MRQATPTMTNGTRFENIDVDSITISQYNERTKGGMPTNELVDDIEENGIEDPPLVRPAEDDDYEWEIIYGQRRFNAAKELGFDTIPCKVDEDMSDLEAAIASTRENYRGSLGSNVSAGERAMQLWRATEVSEYGEPSPSFLGEEFGVPHGTVRMWVEPLREEWEGTPVDPRFLSENGEDREVIGATSLLNNDGTYTIFGDRITNAFEIDEIGISNLRRIRSMTTGDELEDPKSRLYLAYLATKTQALKGENLSTLSDFVKRGTVTLSDFLESDYVDFNNYDVDLNTYLNEAAEEDDSGEKEVGSDGIIEENEDVSETEEEDTQEQNEKSRHAIAESIGTTTEKQQQDTRPNSSEESEEESESQEESEEETESEEESDLNEDGINQNDVPSGYASRESGSSTSTVDREPETDDSEPQTPGEDGEDHEVAEQSDETEPEDTQESQGTPSRSATNNPPDTDGIRARIVIEYDARSLSEAEREAQDIADRLENAETSVSQADEEEELSI